MTATFSADVTLAEAQRRLAQIGQWLPIDGDERLSLGTLVAGNSTGPLRLGYGAWRDLLLGVQFRNGRGDLITAGGRTVKNVAGYDLTKFMVGQRGQIGTLVTLTTRTYRRPEGAIVIEMPPKPAVLNELLPSPLRPQWAVLTASTLQLGYVGDARMLQFWRQQLTSLQPILLIDRSLDADIQHRLSLWCDFGDVTFRASIPPASLDRFAHLAKLDRWTADAAFGIVVGPAVERHAVRDAAGDLGGTCSFSDEPPVLSGVERSLIDRLIKGFQDPAHVPATGGDQGVRNV